MLPFGRNFWPSAAAEMLAGPGYRPISSPSPTRNRLLCYEQCEARKEYGFAEEAKTLTPSSATAPTSLCPGIDP